MDLEFDTIEIAVVDLDNASRAYALLLGCSPTRQDDRVRFQLQRGAVVLKKSPPGEHHLSFTSAATKEPYTDQVEGVVVHVRPPGESIPYAPSSDTAFVTIDHVVVRTTAPQRAIQRWRDERGLRLAFDREFPPRGLRLLFFRSAGVTLEYAAPYPAVEDTGPDQFYGISYRTANLVATHARLRAAGIDVSEIRRGHRPGSSVCSVRSGTCDIPTLLIERESSSDAANSQ